MHSSRHGWLIVSIISITKFSVVSSEFETTIAPICKEGSITNNPKDCNSYLVCVHETEKVVPCPAGLQFNKDKTICDWPANANCGGNENSDKNEIIVDTTSGPPPAHGMLNENGKLYT